MFRTFSSALFASVASAAAADYTTNGADWHDLCEFGKEQSPIDLTGATDNGKMELIGYNYYDFKVNTSFKTTDVTKTISFDTDALRKKAELELNFADGSKSYFQPLQFHFHSPSEHTVDGKHYDLEVHFVHTVRGSDNVAGSVPQAEMAGAVIGVFFDTAAGGDYENAFIKGMDTAILGRGLSIKPKVPVRDFLSRLDMSEYWSYDGSLTTPPCTEGLKWSVLKQVQPISAAQLLSFTKNLEGNAAFAGGKGNNRVIQLLNDRTLYMAADVGAASYMMASVAIAAAVLSF